MFPRLNALLLGILLFFILCFPGQALADGIPINQTLWCDSGEQNTRSTNEASKTDTLYGDLLTLRYVTLDDELAWPRGTNPKVHDTGLLASIETHGFYDLYQTEAWMIYTIGHEERYRAALRTFGAITKLPGGYAFQTIEAAQAEIIRRGKTGAWSVWGVEAEWDTDVFPSPDGPYHVLLIEAPIVDLAAVAR